MADWNWRYSPEEICGASLDPWIACAEAEDLPGLSRALSTLKEHLTKVDMSSVCWTRHHLTFKGYWSLMYMRLSNDPVTPEVQKVLEAIENVLDLL